MTMGWEFIIDFGLISLSLLLATFLRAKIKFLQKYLIPNNIVAGFILLLVSNETLHIIEISSARFGQYVYHLLAITFIAMALKKGVAGKSRSALATGLLLTIGYSMQALIGLTITFGAIWLFMPSLFPNFGYFLVLGFGQGPGQAYALGSSWETLGFAKAGQIGLSFAAIGYIWACFAGIIFINYKRRVHRSNTLQGGERDDHYTTGIISDVREQPSAGRLVTDSSAIDGAAFQIALVAAVYLFTFAVLKCIDYSISWIGGESNFVSQLQSTLWGLHFVFGNIFAIGFRKVISAAGRDYLLDDELMTRISSVSLDFMVTAAIAAVSISALAGYLPLILIITTVGGLLTLFVVAMELGKSKLSDRDVRVAAVFGTLTGTLSTGLTLLRINDPRFKTDVAQDLVYGCGISLPLAAPIFLSMVIPLMGQQSGSPPLYYISMLAALSVYTAFLFILWRRVSRK